MTKSFFRGYLAFLAAMILFSLSPFAGLGGLVVVAVLFIPLSIVLASVGMLEKGSAVDDQFAFLFWVFAGVLSLAAFALAYLAADSSEKGESELARLRAALAATALTTPIVIYLCYNALGI